MALAVLFYAFCNWDKSLSLMTALIYGTFSRSSASGSFLPCKTSKASGICQLAPHRRILLQTSNFKMSLFWDVLGSFSGLCEMFKGKRKLPRITRVCHERVKGRHGHHLWNTHPTSRRAFSCTSGCFARKCIVHANETAVVS